MKDTRHVMEQGLLSVAVLMYLALAAGCATAGAPRSASFGVVDPQKVLNETTAGKQAKDSLATFMKNRQALIELEEKELRRMEEDLLKQASVLSAAAKKEREAQFRRRMLEYQQKVGAVQREVQDKQQEVLEAFRERVEGVASKVAKERGLQLVIEKGRGSPTIYHDSALDISDAVIRELNRADGQS
ncbi:MAG: OmpH family outer membrane protein [Nitrospirales bacterium]